MNLLVYIKPAIQYANAILMTIKEMLKSLALLKEATEDIDYETEFAFFGDSVSETTDQVEELVQAMTTLLGFDTLNILGDTSTNASIEGLSVEGRILDALKEYNMNLDEVTFKAKEVSESLLTWLGYVKVLNEETGEYNWILGEGYTNIEKIKDVALGLITFIASSTIFTKIATLVTKIGSISSILGTIVGTIGGIAIVVGTLVEGFRQVYNSNESFRNSINSSLANIKTNLLTIWDALNSAFNFIKPALNVVWNVIKEIGAILGNNIIKKFEILTEILTGDFVGAWQVIQNLLQDTGDSIARIFGQENMQTMIINLGTWLKENIFEPIKTFFTQSIPNWFTNVWNTIVQKLTQFKDWIKTTIINPIGIFFINMINSIIVGFQNTINFLINSINKLTSGLSSLWEWVGIPPIPQIENVTFNTIPALATGGVIQQPTMALMGEYANAKSNPEIVTPENLMRQVFVESMLPIAQAIISGDREVVNAIGELANRPIELNGRKVSENIYDDMNKVAIRKTGRPLGYVG